MKDYKNFKLLDMYSDYGDITGIQIIRRFIIHINKHMVDMNESIQNFATLYDDMVEKQGEFEAFIIAWEQLQQDNANFVDEVTTVMEDWIDDARVQAWIVDRLDLMIANDLATKLEISVFESFKTTINGQINLKADKTELIDGLELKADKKYVDEKIDTTNNYRQIQAFAHRGMSKSTPENSIPSFIKAGLLGVEGIETDLQITTDGVIYVMHDETVDRTTNGTGRLWEKTSAQVKALKLDHTHTERYHPNDLIIPTIDDVLSICKDYNLKPMLELKYTWNSNDVQILFDKLKKYNLYDDVIISSFKDPLIILVKSLDENIKTQRIFDRLITEQDILDTKNMGQNMQLNLNFRNNPLNQSLINMMNEYNIEYGFWTVNEVSDVEDLKKKNPTFIVGDYGYGGKLKETTRKNVILLKTSTVDFFQSKKEAMVFHDDVDVEVTYQSIQVRYKQPFEKDTLLPVLLSPVIIGDEYKNINLVARAQNRNGFDINVINLETGLAIPMARFRPTITSQLYIGYVAYGVN